MLPSIKFQCCCGVFTKKLGDKYLHDVVQFVLDIWLFQKALRKVANTAQSRKPLIGTDCVDGACLLPKICFHAKISVHQFSQLTIDFQYF